MSAPGVSFAVKDRKRGEVGECVLSLEEFRKRLSHHVPDRYRHGVRYFGLLAPRRKAELYSHLFHLLGQRRAPKPPRVSWAWSLRKTFGVDPLQDSGGRPMRWKARIPPGEPRL